MVARPTGHPRPPQAPTTGWGHRKSRGAAGSRAWPMVKSRSPARSTRAHRLLSDGYRTPFRVTDGRRRWTNGRDGAEMFLVDVFGRGVPDSKRGHLQLGGWRQWSRLDISSGRCSDLCSLSAAFPAVARVQSSRLARWARGRVEPLHPSDGSPAGRACPTSWPNDPTGGERRRRVGGCCATNPRCMPSSPMTSSANRRTSRASWPSAQRGQAGGHSACARSTARWATPSGTRLPSATRASTSAGATNAPQMISPSACSTGPFQSTR